MRPAIDREAADGALSNVMRSLVISFAALSVASPSSFAQNLIQAGGFEGCTIGSQSCVPWQFGGTAILLNFPHTGITSVDVNNGSAGAGTLSQTISLSKSGIYNLSFFYNGIAVVNGSVNGSAAIGGQTVFNQTLVSSAVIPPFTEFSANVRLMGNSALLLFSGMPITGNVGFNIDDISLTFLGPSLLTPLLPQSASFNAISVASGIDNAINNFGELSGGLQNLSNLSGSQLSSALLQVDGEVATGAERAAFQQMNEFVGLMLDPFVEGRFGGGSSSFAPDRSNVPPEIAMAYASVLKAAPKPLLDNQWSAWGTGYGGSSHANGNANIGSTDANTNTYGFASGADYHLTRDTLVGFALAGAGTNWGLAQSLGNGRSDTFQAGVYGKTAFGPVYVAGAFAYTENWFITNRLALGDQLTGRFTGESFGGRLESGYRFVVPSSLGQLELSPYTAIQAQSFHTPNYSETDLTGGGLGLNFNAMTATDTRNEFGMRFADITAVDGMPLIFRAKLAWAHDWVDNPALSATFQSLPGSSFVVNGAPIPSDSALVSVGGELHINAHWSAIAKFDGEFAGNSQTYAGMGTLRYTW